MGLEGFYLGDGVYASFDGYAIVLDLRGQDDTTRIVLEPDVLRALDRYRQALAPAAGAEQGECNGQNRKVYD